jgi:hypothetical protein
MKIGSHPVDLIVDTCMTHLVVTQPVGPLSQKHVAIVRVMGDQTCHPFLASRKNVILENMK